MALWRTLTWKSKEEMIDFLNGIIIGTVNIHDGAIVDNLTVVIDAGAGDKTCTFQPAKSRAWTASEIVVAINAVVGIADGTATLFVRNSIAPRPPDRRLSLGWDPAIEVKAGGTANTALGLSAQTQVITPATAVENVYRNVDGQDSWTALVYS